MARTDPQIALRITADLKARVVASAKANNRSINAEIAYQLQRAYDRELWVDAEFEAEERNAHHRRTDRETAIAAVEALMDSMAGNS